MSRMELFSPEELRIDGRRWNELRRFDCSINTHPNSSDGSSYVEQGNTKIICQVQGPMEPPSKAQSNPNAAVVEFNIFIANFSTVERKKRMRNEKRIVELKTTLERTFEQSVMCKLYPRTTIQVSLHVLAQDGGLLAAMANATTLALIDAGIAMYDYVAAANAGLHDATPLLDLNSLEEHEMSSVTIGVVGESEKIALLLLEDKLPLTHFDSLLALAIAGSHRIRSLMDDEVRAHASIRASKLS